MVFLSLDLLSFASSNYAGSLASQHIVVFIPPRKDVIGKWNNLRGMSSNYPNL